MMGATTIDPQEIAQFNALASTWWDEAGPFRPLHRINPVRLGFIRETLIRHFQRDPASMRPFEGLRVLDVGCGGGLVSEPLARMGFAVTGLDAAEDVLAAARAHAEENYLTIDYRCGAVETLAGETLAGQGMAFDAVVALEVIEHTPDPASFVGALATVLRPGGALILSTLNRTPKSYALGIVAAEWLLRWVPQGTHSWSKFVRPSELAGAARLAGLALTDLVGMSFDPARNRWSLSSDIGVNYLAAFAKPA